VGFAFENDFHSRVTEDISKRPAEGRKANLLLNFRAGTIDELAMEQVLFKLLISGTDIAKFLRPLILRSIVGPIAGAVPGYGDVFDTFTFSCWRSVGVRFGLVSIEGGDRGFGSVIVSRGQDPTSFTSGLQSFLIL
jgi:hypothetical protein